LPDYVKDIFKTAIEINQNWTVKHAADRQPFICQSQSLNLFFPADVGKKELHDVHMFAWKEGVKTLYYLRSEAFKRSDDLNKKIERYNFKFEESDCLACEG
jgi:ribonucleoside-diphosphate reductase alpha chain